MPFTEVGKKVGQGRWSDWVTDTVYLKVEEPSRWVDL